MFKPPRREIEQIKRLNLIPVMDAVFIFIFFLLFSAEFIKIYELSSDAPVVSEVPEDQTPEKEPLNLTVKITSRKIVLSKGIDSVVFREIIKNEKGYDLKLLKDIALSLKKKNLKDKYAIVAPDKNIKYEVVVQIMDALQQLPNHQKELKFENKGKEVKLYKIFDQIVLEPNT